MADILGRWNHLTKLLYNQLQGKSPENVVANTRERIHRFAIDVDQRITPLTKPKFNDPCFKGIRFGFPKGTRDALLKQGKNADRVFAQQSSTYLDPVKIPTTTDPQQLGQTIIELERLLINAKRRAKDYARALRSAKERLGRMLAAAATGRAFLPHSKNLYSGDPGPCWCGCGEKVNFLRNENGTPIGIYRFRRGHSLTYTKRISLVERGFERWEDLPVLLKEKIKWVACKKCRGPIPACDPFGAELKPADQIGIACWRERLGVHWPYKRPKKLPRGSHATPARLRSSYQEDAR